MKKSEYQEMVALDITDVFLNLDEFGSEHMVAGKNIKIVISSDQNTVLPKGYAFGVTDTNIVIFGSTEDLPSNLEPGTTLNIDGGEYNIDKANVDMGMAELYLSITQ